MAIVNTKKYIDLADLTLFKELNDSAMASAIATAEARSIHTVAFDSATNTINFYREEEPVGGATPAYSVEFPDLSDYLEKLESATGGKVLASKADGTFEESSVNVSDLVVDSDLATVATSGDAADVSIADVGGYFTADDVEGALAELALSTGGGVASKTVYVTETAGGSEAAYSKRYGIYQGSEGSALDPDPTEKLVDIDIPKDMVVEDGEVVDVVYDNGHLYEGSTSGTDVTEEIKGEGGTATATDAGKYIKLTIANTSGDHLWIKATDLVDIYTSGSNPSTDELIITISNNNEITASVGSVGIASAKVNYAVADVYNVDSTVNASNFDTKIASGIYTKSGNTYTQVQAGATFDEAETYYTKIDAHSETVQSALARLDAAVGQGGSVDAKIAAAIAELDATASQTAAAGNGQLALSVTEVDGKITAISGSITAETYDAYGAAATAKSEVIGESTDTASANTIYGAKKYADSLSTNYATAAQGAKADSALQLSDVATETEIRRLFAIDAYIVGSTALASDWLALSAGGSAITPAEGPVYLIKTAGEYQDKYYTWDASESAYVEA